MVKFQDSVDMILFRPKINGLQQFIIVNWALKKENKEFFTKLGSKIT